MAHCYAGVGIYNFVRGNASYENEFVKLSYSREWKPDNINEVGLCTEARWDCFLVLKDDGTTFPAGIAFTQINWQSNQTLEGAHEGLWQEFIIGWDGNYHCPQITQDSR